MKRIAFVMAVVAMGGCSKGEQKPAAAADTSHNMMIMSDTSKMMVVDTSKHVMMMDTSKKMAPPAKKKP